MLETLTREQFAQCLATTFQVVDEPDARFGLVLTDVSELKTGHGQESFSLLFRGPGERFMPQAIHRLRHDRLGELDIFLVPVGRDENGFQYEAVFNRLV